MPHISCKSSSPSQNKKLLMQRKRFCENEVSDQVLVVLRFMHLLPYSVKLSKTSVEL